MRCAMTLTALALHATDWDAASRTLAPPICVRTSALGTTESRPLAVRCASAPLLPRYADGRGPFLLSTLRSRSLHGQVALTKHTDRIHGQLIAAVHGSEGAHRGGLDRQDADEDRDGACDVAYTGEPDAGDVGLTI